MDNNMIKSTVIIPVYNMELYLVECLESVVNQLQKEIEIIIVDDGSTDNSVSIIEEYEKRYDNIKVIRQSNSGLGAARNAGLKVANGEFVYFLDSDDFIDPDMLTVCYAFCKRNNLEVIMFDSNVVIDEGVEGNFIPECYDRKEIIRKWNRVYRGTEYLDLYMDKTPDIVTAWSFYSSREFLQKNSLKFPTKVLYEDEAFRFKMMAHAKRVMYIPRTFYNRRYRAGSIMTSGFSVNKNGDLISAIYSMLYYLENLNKEETNVFKRYIYMRLEVLISRYKGIVNIEDEEMVGCKLLSLIELFQEKLLSGDTLQNMYLTLTIYRESIALFKSQTVIKSFLQIYSKYLTNFINILLENSASLCIPDDLKKIELIEKIIKTNCKEIAIISKRCEPDLFQKVREAEINFRSFTAISNSITNQLQTCLNTEKELDEEENFLSCLKNKSTLILYGAGARGVKIANYLKERGIQIASFAVTDKGGEELIGGITVRNISELIELKEKAVILITTSAKFQTEIEESLTAKGFKNIIKAPNEKIDMWSELGLFTV